jgi:hypothetical protein
MANTYILLNSYTVPSGGISSIFFDNISNAYTDLNILCSVRSSAAFTADAIFTQFNGSASSFVGKNLYATGTNPVVSQSFTDNTIASGINGANSSASIWSNTTIYISNYAGSTNKVISSDGRVENNATRGDVWLQATSWANASAISSIRLLPSSGATFTEFSTAYLYGIKNT